MGDSTRAGADPGFGLGEQIELQCREYMGVKYRKGCTSLLGCGSKEGTVPLS